MNYEGYIDSLCLVAFVAYSKPRFNRELSQATEKIEALLKYCGFKKDIGSRPVMLEAAISAVSEHDDALKSLTFTSGAIVAEYALCLIPECVVPPENCPQRVGALLEEAFNNHNDSNFQQAMDLYKVAQELWVNHIPDTKCEAIPELPLEQRLYFTVAMGSVLQSDGQDKRALKLYCTFEKEVHSQKCLNN